jgi:hypothetical protein
MDTKITWLAPKKLPTGLRFFNDVQGRYAGEYWLPANLPKILAKMRESGSEHADPGWDPDQVAVRYRFGRGADDFTQLSVSWTPNAGAVMIGTDHQRAREVMINHRTAQYHDGQWAPGPGADQLDTPVGALHWDRTREHAVTLRTGSAVFGVRCPRDLVPDVGDLVAILASVPRAAAL